jgi:hypothetical protein
LSSIYPALYPAVEAVSCIGRAFAERYVAALKAAGKPSWKETEKGLNKIADTLGRNRLAREIEADKIVELIRPIYEHGA